MRRDQTAHERLIPLLVELVGARTYLEFGTGLNATISKVRCEKRYGVDVNVQPCDGCEMFKMSTEEFINTKAESLGPFDFVWIDADHSLDAVRRDFIGISRYVSAEGTIGLHDTQPEHNSDAVVGFCGDAWRYAHALWVAGSESYTLNMHPGITLVRNRRFWGPTP